MHNSISPNEPRRSREPAKKTRNSPLKHQMHHWKQGRHLGATVAVAPEAAFLFFRDFANLPLFMKDLKSVEVLTPERSRWTVEVKGVEASWEAEIIDERPGEMIAWQSVEGSKVETRGAIWFTAAPEYLGTEIHLDLEYKVPGGKLTELITKMTGEDPRSLAFTNLRRLKCLLETGEIATTEGQPSGRDENAETIIIQ